MVDSGTRGSYYAVRDLLRARLEERPPGRIQLLAGPRQVGKTTLLLELAEGFGERAIYAAADAPEASIPGFWERLWTRVESVATKHRGTSKVHGVAACASPPTPSARTKDRGGHPAMCLLVTVFSAG
jgi:hypothetical protein